MNRFRTETIGDATLILGDCREVLQDVRADALVTDPPYGINAARDRNSQKNGWRDYAAPGWDQERPDAATFAALLGCAQHAIIWGGNYFADMLPASSRWLVWDKGQTDFSLADVELAWCSFDGAARRIMVPRSVALQDGKEHPTQKPISVMRWTINQLPVGCGAIVDPFMGSGTTGVAASQMDRTFIGIEREPAFFDIACRRIEEAYKQPRLFEEPQPKAVQPSMLAEPAT